MVNVKAVNGEPSNFFLPHFCESFCDPGRFLHFKIPVKYICNQKLTAGSAPHCYPLQNYCAKSKSCAFAEANYSLV